MVPKVSSSTCDNGIAAQSLLALGNFSTLFSLPVYLSTSQYYTHTHTHTHTETHNFPAQPIGQDFLKTCSRMSVVTKMNYYKFSIHKLIFEIILM